MTQYTAVLMRADGSLFAAAGFFSYDDAVAYIADWSEMGMASIVDFATGELLFTLAPVDDGSPS